MVAAMSTVAAGKLENPKSHSNVSEKSVIRPVLDPAYMVAHQLGTLPVEIPDCNYCRRATRYAKIEDAIHHLKTFHIVNQTDADTFQPSRLTHYVVSLEIEWQERAAYTMIQLLRASNERCRKLLSKAVELRSSVANEENNRSHIYVLPPALVKTAEKVFELIYTTTHVMCFVKDHLSTESELWASPSMILEAIECLDNPTKAASSAMSKASDALLLMAHTRRSHNTVVYTPCTPEGIVLYSIIILTIRDSVFQGSLVELYRRYHSKLVSFTSP